MSVIKKIFRYGEQEVTIETGLIARQATGAVRVTMGETTVLVTVVGMLEAEKGRSFFPLTVSYQVRTYAAGKIPGGFMKREGRPSEQETLISRLIDRPLRPCFPKAFMNEIQVIAMVLSLDPEVQPDILALIGASAALAISGIPFAGPVAAARVGYVDGQYLLNPSFDTVEKHSALDLVVAGTEQAVLMVESGANQLSEEVMLGAVLYGHEQMQVVIEAIKDFAQEASKPAWDWMAPAVDASLEQRVTALAADGIRQAYAIPEKTERLARLRDLRAQMLQVLSEENMEVDTELALTFFAQCEKQHVRKQVIAGHPRIDGRDTRTVRPISIELGMLPRTHGSALFTRGETQAIVSATLGTERDAKIIDDLNGDRKDMFMLHYNFPPFCVGECGFISSPKRREIGHGHLAKRAISAVLPNPEVFPYALRVVSEITESNGSSSMATVCGASLTLMDAGVPLENPVAGIAMGLIKEGDDFAVLTDILGDEDHLGDMDFKVAGTDSGITALQMDIKINGITPEIMRVALEQAREARLHILSVMGEHIHKARNDISDYAPRFLTVNVKPEKVRDVIGKGGATVRDIIAKTGVSIDISDDGTVKISAVDNGAVQQARQMVEDLVAEVEVGQIYEGKIVKLIEFGAFVSLMPGRDGFLHISEIQEERIADIQAVLSEGQIIRVKVIGIDRQNRVRVSVKALAAEIDN